MCQAKYVPEKMLQNVTKMGDGGGTVPLGQWKKNPYC